MNGKKARALRRYTIALFMERQGRPEYFKNAYRRAKRSYTSVPRDQRGKGRRS